MKIKLLAYLSIAVALSSLVACNNKTPSYQSVSDEEAMRAVQDGDIFVFDDEHLATDTIHQGINSVTYSDKIVIRNASSTYKLVHDGSDAAVKIAGKVRTTVNSLFNFYLDVESTDEAGPITDNSEFIVFSTNQSAFASLFPSEDEIKDYGYAIKTQGNCLYVLAYGDKGMNNAYNAFAKVFLGYEPLFDLDVYSYQGENVNKSTTIYLPNCDIVELPDFLHRARGQTLTNAYIDKMNYERPYSFYYSVGDGSPHNSLQILPYSKFGSAHPNWYSKEHKQLCYTAHGNETEYQALVKELGNYCFKHYEEDPSKNNAFMIGQMDQAGDNLDAYLCTCDNCTKVMNKYNDPDAPGQKAHSALMIKLFNDVDNYIQQEKHVNDIKLIFFAYQDSMIAPYDPNGELLCNDNVGVYCAPSRASYTHSFYDEMQKDMEKDYPKICKDWGKFTKSLYLWLYQTQFQSVLYPFQSWSSTIDNCRFVHECNGVLIFPEGDEFNNEMTAFGRFKDYLYAKGMYNVNSSYSALKDLYFSNYYGAAGEIMRTLYDQIVSYLTYLGTKQQGVYKGLITEPPYNKREYWNKTLLQQWVTMIDQALEVLDDNKRAANYDIYKKHVEIEGVFPIFALLELFRNELDTNTFSTLAARVAKYCRTYAIQYRSEANKSENVTLDNTLFREWGV